MGGRAARTYMHARVPRLCPDVDGLGCVRKRASSPTQARCTHAVGCIASGARQCASRRACARRAFARTCRPMRASRRHSLTASQRARGARCASMHVRTWCSHFLSAGGTPIPVPSQVSGAHPVHSRCEHPMSALAYTHSSGALVAWLAQAAKAQSMKLTITLRGGQYVGAHDQ